MYRKIEILTEWARPVVDRLPKTTAFTAMGSRTVNELQDAMAAVTIGLLSEKGEPRLNAANLLIVRMVSVKTAFRIYYSYASQTGNPRVLTAAQYAYFLRSMKEISVETERWRAANAKKD